MDKVTDSLRNLGEIIIIHIPEMVFVLFLLIIPVLAYVSWRMRHFKSDPNLNGLKILENYQSQALIRITSPGNILALPKMFPQTKSLLLRMQFHESKELEFSIQLLKQVAASRGVAIVKVDEYLFLVEGTKDKVNPFEDLSKVKVIDFEGLEVMH
jgi:flagellar biogenesis protein FliO